jgi:hypothetical protein
VFVRHGAMHVAHAAFFIPVVAGLCSEIGVIKPLNQREMLAAIIVALFHDYGRRVENCDLTSDNYHMEKIGYERAVIELGRHGFTQEEAKKYAQTILDKDKAENDKSDIAFVLHEADVLAVMRADDWQFNPKYLHLTNAQKTPEQAEKLWQIVDEIKLFLASCSDSPLSQKAFSEKYKALYPNGIEGAFNLERKIQFEKNPTQLVGTFKDLISKQPALSAYMDLLREKRMIPHDVAEKIRPENLQKV